MSKKLFTIFLIIGISAVQTFASGFQINENGARAMGMSGAFVGLANDPSAVYFNPAGITQLLGTHFSIGATFISPSTKFTGPANIGLPAALATQEFRLRGADRSHSLKKYQKRLSPNFSTSSYFRVGSWGQSYL